MRGALIIPLLVGAAPSLAQERAAIGDSLVAKAFAANPHLRAAEAQASAARARVGPAGAWPDPMLMAGIQNLPLTRESAAGHAISAGADPMTMKMVGATQTVPYPGKKSAEEVEDVECYDVWSEWADETGHEFENDGSDCCPEYAYPDCGIFEVPE